MKNYYTPLRYPGGKTKLYPFIKNLISVNQLLGQTYIEPFAGGAGLALKLLFSGDVKRIIINDLDPAIYSLWYSILNSSTELCSLIQNTPVTVDEWQKQKSIYCNGANEDQLAFGFSTFYLNRTNVSGIIKSGGIIGGLSQTGNYLMDARYNKSALIKLIEAIAAKKEQIIITNMDAKVLLSINFLKHYKKVFIYCDPPYVQKGEKLYKNSFTKEDHIALYNVMKTCHRKWLVTYDICNFIEDVYQNSRKSRIDINYSAKTVRVAQEFAFFSDNLILPPNILLV